MLPVTPRWSSGAQAGIPDSGEQRGLRTALLSLTPAHSLQVELGHFQKDVEGQIDEEVKTGNGEGEASLLPQGWWGFLPEGHLHLGTPENGPSQGPLTCLWPELVDICTPLGCAVYPS